MIDKKTKSIIINNMRRIFRFSKVYKEALLKNNVESKLYLCNSCGNYIYTGISETNYNSFVKKYKKVIKGKVEVDHIDPVVPVNKSYSDMSLDDYASRLFCDITNLDVLCKDCHSNKTKKEKLIRTKKKRKN